MKSISIKYLKRNSASTIEAFDEFDGITVAGCGADSVYTILIQFPASSMVDTAADTTSITMLSDTEMSTDMDTPRNNARLIIDL